MEEVSKEELKVVLESSRRTRSQGWMGGLCFYDLIEEDHSKAIDQSRT